jgi:hypothetical protein
VQRRRLVVAGEGGEGSGGGGWESPIFTEFCDPPFALMFADLFKIEIQNYIGIQYYVNYLLFTSFFCHHNTAKYVDEQLQHVTSSVRYKNQRSKYSHRPTSSFHFFKELGKSAFFLEGRFITPLSCYCPKTSSNEQQ